MYKVCVGFGEFEGKCQNPAGCKHTPYWCERCNILRMVHIEESLNKIIANFQPKRGRIKRE